MYGHRAESDIQNAHYHKHSLPITTNTRCPLPQKLNAHYHKHPASVSRNKNIPCPHLPPRKMGRILTSREIAWESNGLTERQFCRLLRCRMMSGFVFEQI